MLHGLVLEEEALPAGAPAPTSRAAATLDVAQVRAEIAQLRPEATAPVAVLGRATPAPDREPAAPSAGGGAASPRDDAEAALRVLSAALASERDRTSALRAEIDALQITLASTEGRLHGLREERDLWAGRARHLAQVMVREADAVQGMLDAVPPRPVSDARAA